MSHRYVLFTLFYFSIFIFFNYTKTVFADQIYTDDVIIQGSMCVGTDCVNGEVFSFDTIILKEGIVNILFNDVDNDDWRIGINLDTVNEGCFLIENVTRSTVPFKIKAGAVSDSLVVDTTGRIGIGTDSPTERVSVSGNALFRGDMAIGSSRDYKSNICPIESGEAVKALRGLKPVKYNLKKDPEEDSVGFIAEDLPDMVSTKSRKSLNPVYIIAILAKTIQRQNESIEMLSRKLDKLEQEFSKQYK